MNSVGFVVVDESTLEGLKDLYFNTHLILLTSCGDSKPHLTMCPYR